MTRRPPYEPRDQERGDLEPITGELERYAQLTAGEMPHGLPDRVMASLAAEPTPRRGALAWLLAPFSTSAGGGTRLVMVAGTMALAVLAVVVAGQLAALFGDPQIGPSPSPPVQTPSPTPSVTPSPSPSQTPSVSPTPLPSASPVIPTPVPSPTGSDDDDETETPEPSDDDSSGPGGGDDEPETPEPSDDDSSGPGGGDDDE